MSVHQVIYTSCRRGIFGTNDGQQIYSLDRGLENSLTGELQELFGYLPPAPPAGTDMTQELARSMPASFRYRRLSDGRCAAALSSCLGRDYMGAAGRFGNYLSHVIVFDPEDTDCRPFRFYGSAALRDHMDPEEVNSPEKPDYLPEPRLVPGCGTEPESISAFLRRGNRMEICKDMLCALLSFYRENRRLIICDSRENVILWIAALTSVLPRDIALDVSFSTYEYDPQASPFRITGAERQGTRFDPSAAENSYVFDLIGGTRPTPDRDREFCAFAETGLTVSRECLEDFHTFLRNYDYHRADDGVIAAYRLYSLLSDGIPGAGSDGLRGAVDFALRFALPAERTRLKRWLTERREALLQADAETFLTLAELLSEPSVPAEPGFRRLMADRALQTLTEPEKSGEPGAFLPRAAQLCRRVGVSLYGELTDHRLGEVLAAVDADPVRAGRAVTELTAAAVREGKLTPGGIAPYSPAERILNTVLRGSAAGGEQSLDRAVGLILDAFGFDAGTLTAVMLSLRQLPESAWQRYGEKLLRLPDGAAETAWEMLGGAGKYPQAFALYAMELDAAPDPAGAGKVFASRMDSALLRDGDFVRGYLTPMLERYYRALCRFDERASRPERLSLLEMLAAERYAVPFAKELTEGLIRPIPLKKPGREDEKLIRTALRYLADTGFGTEGKLQLLAMGVTLHSARRAGDLAAELRKLAGNGQADLTGLGEKTLEDYLEWIVPPVLRACPGGKGLTELLGLFRVSGIAERELYGKCAAQAARSCRGEEEYARLLTVLSAALQKDRETRRAVGRALSSAGEKRLKELDARMRAVLPPDGTQEALWQEMLKEAHTANPVLNALSRLFRRKSD